MKATEWVPVVAAFGTHFRSLLRHELLLRFRSCAAARTVVGEAHPLAARGVQIEPGQRQQAFVERQRQAGWKAFGRFQEPGAMLEPFLGFALLNTADIALASLAADRRRLRPMFNDSISVCDAHADFCSSEWGER